MLVSNTAALIKRFEEEALQQEAQRQQAAREGLVKEQRLQARQQASAEVRPADERRAQSGQWNSGAGDRQWLKRASARKDDLDRFRAQKALHAAKEAISRHPELGAYPPQEVAAAMVRAKAAYLEKGLNLDSEGSAEAIRLTALALLPAGR